MTLDLDSIVPQRVERFGWKPDKPDHRDHIVEEAVDGAKLDPKRDLWETNRMIAIFDQLQLGSCTGNGWARVMSFIKAMKDANVSPEMFSRLFIYYFERVIEGTVSSDSGAEIRDGAKVVATNGVPPEDEWPYDINRFADKPTAQVDADAKKELALEYKRIVIGTPGSPMRAAISNDQPIVFGFPVPDYFEQQDVWDPTSQELPIPDDTWNGNWIGGHCVVVTGYDFTKEKYPVPVFICDNSWGTDWGQDGRFAMDYRWFTPRLNLASDLWIVETVS